MDFTKIKEIRKQKKISLSDIAKRTGISRGTLTSIENGKGKVSFENVETYLNALDYKLIYLPKQ